MFLNLTLAAKLEQIQLPCLRPMLYGYDLQPTPLQEVTENWSMNSMEIQAPVCCGVDAKFIWEVRILRSFNPSSAFSLPLSQLGAPHLLVVIAVSALLALLTCVPPPNQHHRCVCQRAANGLSHGSLGKDGWPCTQQQRSVFGSAYPDFG